MTSQKHTLRECPFCGCPAEYLESREHGRYRVACTSDGCQAFLNGDYAEGVMRHWDTRAGSAALVAERHRLKFYLQKIATGTGDNSTWAVEQAREALTG